jgi:hypothetical protein
MAWILRSLTTKNIISREAALLDKEIQRINQILQETTKEKKKLRWKQDGTKLSWQKLFASK